MRWDRNRRANAHLGLKDINFRGSTSNVSPVRRMNGSGMGFTSASAP